MIKPGDLQYLRSRQRRGKGRWAHYYRRDEKEISLGVHGLHPTDPRVFAAYCAAHARWEEKPPETEVPKGGTFAWAVEIYQATSEWKTGLKAQTRQNREAIYRRYIKAQGARSLTSITRDTIEAALLAKGGHAAVNELKALRPVTTSRPFRTAGRSGRSSDSSSTSRSTRERPAPTSYTSRGRTSGTASSATTARRPAPPLKFQSRRSCAQSSRGRPTSPPPSS